MRSERERREEFIILAGKVNEHCGKDIDDEVLLDDLFNYSIECGIARGNPPVCWLEVLSALDPIEKMHLIGAIGIANKRLSKIIGHDATLRDLRNTKIEEMIKWEGQKKLSNVTAELIMLSFIK